MKYFLSFLIFILFLLGCKSEQCPVGSGLTGNIQGKTYLYLDNGLRLQDNSNIQVSIEGNTYSTLTSYDGSWELVEVPAGVYTLVFSKTGFETVKYFNVQFVGSGTYDWGSISLGQIPNVTITQLNITGPDEHGYFNIQVSISSADSLYREVDIIYDKSPISDLSTTTFLFGESHIIKAYATSFSATLENLDIYKTEYSLSTGSKLYLRALILPRKGYAISYNRYTGKSEVYNMTSALSKLDSLIIP